MDLKEYRKHINNQLENMSDEEFEDIFEGIECIGFNQMQTDIQYLVRKLNHEIRNYGSREYINTVQEIANRYNIDL